ncbi:enoyl-CoA hydratase/isomerase family protein [Hephaestia sp. GCM10023244]|uniref:enoyl-CoA hydratase/isomerase family protein n=1 Tax=unclassified Hephaestia TaxID=2631281 RepID=UPI00207770BB|nr:enoyl-CoA hydratase-related protein [Hephaestia sp. MAHUQ-44]
MLLERDGAVAIVTLNRPDSLNAIDQAMADELARIGALLAHDESLAVVVLRGAGDGFCAGGDITTFAENLDAIDRAIRPLLGQLHDFLRCLRAMPKLVLTSVHGAVAGAGFSIAFMGDLCIAADNARLRPAYAPLGVSPDGGGTIGVVDAVGARWAMRVFLADEELSHADALALGLVTRIVPAADLEKETLALARRLAQTDAAAIAATKALIYKRAGGDISNQLEAEMEHLIGCMNSASFRDRVDAFVASTSR